MNGLRFTLAAGVAATIACTSFAAQADEETGLAVGVRLAGAVPFGNAHNAASGVPGSTSISMSALDRAAFPFSFDLGYRFTPRLYLGVFYSYAPTFPPSNNCALPPSPSNGVAGGTTCDGSDQKIGLDVQLHLRPHDFLDPWIGLGIGYEINNTNYETGAAADTESYQLSGFMVDLQLGADLRFSKRIPIGPYVDVSLGDFNTENVYSPNATGASVAYGQTVHGWATFGLRAQFNL